MEKSVRQQIFSASSFTTALAIAVPSYVAVPLPGNGSQQNGYIPKTLAEATASDVQLL